MIELAGVYPVMVQPGSHLGHLGGEIGADTPDFHDVEHGPARCSQFFSAMLHKFEGMHFDPNQ